MMARQISAQLLEEKRKASEIDEEPSVNLFNKLGAYMRHHVDREIPLPEFFFFAILGFSGHQ